MYVDGASARVCIQRRPEPQRAGMSSSDVLVTVVLDAEELQGAVQNSAKHIEIRNHIDLTSSEPLNEQQHIVKKMLGWPGAGVESIRVRFGVSKLACEFCSTQRNPN